jgi:hypothetical protein
MLETLITEPAIRKTELARRFNRTAQWVYRITGSAVFQARLAERRAELRARTDADLQAVLVRSLEILKVKLAGDPASVPNALVLRALEITSKACGYDRTNERAPVEIDVELHLAQLGENLIRVLRATRAGTPIDATPVAVCSTANP